MALAWEMAVDTGRALDDAERELEAARARGEVVEIRRAERARDLARERDHDALRMFRDAFGRSL